MSSSSNGRAAACNEVDREVAERRARLAREESLASPQHRGLDLHDAAEVAARKARLDTVKAAHKARTGGDNIGETEAHAIDLDGPAPTAPLPGRRPTDTPGATPREQQLLDAAARTIEPGQPGYPSLLGPAIGISGGRACVLIWQLKAKGLWPYPDPGKGRRPSGANAPRPAAVVVAPASPLQAPSPEPAVIVNTDPEADPELLVIRRVLSQLRRLPNIATMRRVLAYVAQRVEEDAIP